VLFEANLAENWRSFTQKWRNYAIITNLERQTTNYQVALLLHVIGDQTRKVVVKVVLHSTVSCINDYVMSAGLLRKWTHNFIVCMYVLNRDKFEMKLKKITLMGHVIGVRGLQLGWILSTTRSSQGKGDHLQILRS